MRDGSQSGYPMVSLGDESLFKVEGSGTPKSDVPEYWDGGIPWATFGQLFGIKGLEDIKPDPETRVHICTIQGLVKRVLP